MTNPTVSICIVTYNHEKYIHDCILSAILQSYNLDIEILIGDDHSSDKTPYIIESLYKLYPNIIQHVRHEKRIGCGTKNLKILLSKARGDYIAHLDGDDFWMPGKVLKQVNFLENNPECNAVYTNALVIDNNGETIGLFNNRQPTRHTIHSLLERGNFLNHSSTCYRKEFTKKLLHIKGSYIDYTIHLNLTGEGYIGYINEPLVCYRVNSATSIMANANDRVRSLYWESISTLPVIIDLNSSIANFMAEFIRGIFFRSIKNRNLSLLKKWMPLVLQASPVKKKTIIFLIIKSISRVGIHELLSLFASKLSKNRLKILYYR